MNSRKQLLLWCACLACFALCSCVEDLSDVNLAVESRYPDSRSYVDLGLSVKWANCNIGAEYPWEYGSYFCWGETYVKDAYYLDNYFCYRESTEELVEERYYYFETIDHEISGSYSYDAAYYQWGYDWRMPTYSEISELVENCSWRWTSVRGVYGYIVTGPNGNSIFLPAAGDRNGYDAEECGLSGYYWCGTSAYDYGDYYGDSAYLLSFSDGENGDVYYAARSWGFSVRPVYRY